MKVYIQKKKSCTIHAKQSIKSIFNCMKSIKHKHYNNRQLKKHHLHPYTAYTLYIEYIPKDETQYENNLDDFIDKVIDFAEANNAYVTGFGSLISSEQDSDIRYSFGYIDPYINDSVKSKQKCLDFWNTFPEDLKAQFKECKIDIVDSYYSDK